MQSFRESDYFQAFVDWSTKILTESLYAGKLYKDIARVVKNGSIKPSFTGKGLKEAQNALDVTEAFDSERRAYESYVDAQRIDIGVAQSTVLRAEAAEARADKAEARAEEAVRQALRQKEEADVKNERSLANALKTLLAQGMPERQARKTLGLDLPGENPSASI